MNIDLPRKLEEIIQQYVQRGRYQSVDEFLECAVSMLHEQESWLDRHRAEINDKIEEGYASAQRGELADADEVHSILERKKHAWLADQRWA